MKELSGKVAVVTGGGSGLGRELALNCARRGMNVAMCDVDVPGMEKTAAMIASEAPTVQVFTQRTDVSKLDAVTAFADAVYSRYGAAHVLFNNAGVAANAPIWENTQDDWTWVIGVNLLGVGWGIKAFVPRMVAQGGEARVVNTASAAGWLYGPNLGIYNATKSAVVALSETLLADLRTIQSSVGVTVVCPSFFPTGIADAERNRPKELGDSAAGRTTLQEAQLEAIRNAFENSPVSAADVAELSMQAILDDRFYVFPHKEVIDWIRARAHNATSDRNPPGL